MAWFFMLGIAKFSIDLKPLLLPFRSSASKLGLVMFFLLVGGGCLRVDAGDQPAERLEVIAGIDAGRGSSGTDPVVAPYVRGGAKTKKPEKRTPYTDFLRAQPPVDACHFILTDILNRRRHSLPALGYHDHLHRQALF